MVSSEVTAFHSISNLLSTFKALNDICRIQVLLTALCFQVAVRSLRQVVFVKSSGDVV